MPMDDESQDESLSTEPHSCADCECPLHAADQQKSWEFCDFCGEPVCMSCDRTHACADLLRKKPRNW